MYQRIVVSELQERKFRRFFDSADVDGDGVITQNDVEMMGQRFLAARGISANSPDGRRLTDRLTGFWTSVIAPADSDHDGEVGPEEMSTAFAESFADPATSAQVETIGNLFFDLVDTDGDGSISRLEFACMFRESVGLADATCAATFEQLDLDNSGALSRAEVAKAVMEFFYGDDPAAPANNLFGQI